MAATDVTPARAALADNDDVVLSGRAHLLDPYRDRIRIVEIDANEPVHLRRRHRPVRLVRPT
ncbi:MAG TPA: hypothetical protein VGN48_06040 [Pedococcus sp.]|jgi:hypothetical protein|nr:hypothetical protein [Pedococcus sp.]